jgi:hypothetical protein
MEQKTKLPELGTPEHYQTMWDCYYKLAEGLKAGIKLVELRFTENLSYQQINEQLDARRRFENELKICEWELVKLQSFTSAIPRVPPPYEQPVSNQQKPKRKNWLARGLFGR